MEVVRREDGTNATKVLVESNNQICLNAVDFLAGRLKESGKLVTSSRVNRNGGYLMHFYNGRDLAASLTSIKATVGQHDNQAKIVINHCPENSSG
jgi:hypothetical protein